MKKLPQIRIQNIEYRILKTFFGIVLFTILYSLSVIPIHAQTTGIDVAFTRPIADEEAVNGDILITTDQGLVRANEPYLTTIYGVLAENSLIVYRKLATDSAKPIARNGVVAVNVTNLTGDIKEGDYITSSPVPGKGQKAINPGYIIGVAMEDLNTQEAETINFNGRQLATGSILVALKPEFAAGASAGSTGRFIDTLSAQLFKNINDQEGFSRLLRYILAGFIVLISFLIGFIIFAKSIPKAIEAIGRNPLAKSSIQFSIMLNIGFTVLTVILGIAAAYFIVRI